jgi:bla regulator protein blaR1
MRLILLSAGCLAIAFAQAPAFDVASVKPTNRPQIPSFPLDPGNGKPPGGRFSASFDLGSYIHFAYKLEVFQARALNATLPKWATTDMYEIHAKAEGNPTKDQMRLMMQSLLADRFKLKVHFETQQMPVFALTLVKPGQTGPKLIPYDQGPACPDSFALPTPGDLPSDKEVFPPMCGYAMMWSKPSGITLWGSRNSTPQYLAVSIGGYGSFAGEVDKPVVDRTGLSGRHRRRMCRATCRDRRFCKPCASNWA